MVTGFDEQAAETVHTWTFDEDPAWASEGWWGPSVTPATTAAPTDTEPPAIEPASKVSTDLPEFAPVSITGPAVSHAGRMAVGMATLAAERIRNGAKPSTAFVTGVGLLQLTADRAQGFARRMAQPPSRFALQAADLASRLPGANRRKTAVNRYRERLAKLVVEARTRGAATVADGRADATAFVQASVNDTIAWAQAKVVPQIVDGLVPHLVDSVVPRILEGAMPEIRAQVLPVVIDDLTHSDQLRELMLEQGRGVMGEAAQHVRSTTASADDRVESAFRRLVRSPAPEDEPPQSDVDNPE
jgi:hypothetical protein